MVVAEDVIVDNETTNCTQSKDWDFVIFLHNHTDTNQAEFVTVNEDQSQQQKQDRRSAPEVNDDHESKVAERADDSIVVVALNELNQDLGFVIYVLIELYHNNQIT